VNKSNSVLQIRWLVKANAKCKKPKSNILADPNVLPITFKNNCRVTVQSMSLGETVVIDDVKITYNSDCLRMLLHGDEEKFDVRIGNGVWKGSHPCVISSPWSFVWWMTLPQKTAPLRSRQGWSCVMSQDRLHRDMVNDIIGSKYSNLFDQHHFFHYDQNQNCKYDLSKHMMRPRNKHKSTARAKFIFMEDPNKKASWPDGYLGPWHATTICELVTETVVEFFWATEKTVKPIAAGMPFVMIGCKGFLRRLRQIGFRTFHPYIDESYDDIEDWRERCQTATESFFNFIENPNHLEKIQEICDHNQEILTKIQSHDWEHRIWKKIRRFIQF